MAAPRAVCAGRTRQALWTCALGLSGALLGALGAPTASADPYPAKPIHVVVNFAPGGPVDTVARLIAPPMQDELGQPLVIENRTGAGGNIGTVAVARSAPDGYTILVSSSGFAVNPSLSPSAGYDAEKDFVPIAVAATQPNLLVVHPDLPAQNLAELFVLVRSGKYSFATPGSGTTPHLTGEMLFHVLAKADVQAIHFRGAGPAAAAVVAGEPRIGVLAATAPITYVKSGKLRALGISSVRRSPVLPDVPTFVESGYPSIQDYTWVAYLAPAGTPPEITQKLNNSINHALGLADVRARLAALELEAVGGTPEQTRKYLHEELKHWARVVRETGAKLE